ncbi:MAG: hypothetical protein DSY58_00690 [Desulfobulbus sp.]|nr:MAG: hypothetical protein DSY58_00690 [Desulfobulbus sp.]
MPSLFSGWAFLFPFPGFSPHISPDASFFRLWLYKGTMLVTLQAGAENLQHHQPVAYSRAPQVCLHKELLNIKVNVFLHGERLC